MSRPIFQKNPNIQKFRHKTVLFSSDELAPCKFLEVLKWLHRTKNTKILPNNEVKLFVFNETFFHNDDPINLLKQ